MWQQVLLALAIGGAAGYFLGEKAGGFAILGSIFLQLIKMVVAPLIFFALISGITSLSGGKHLRSMAFRGVSTYVLTAFAAVCFGLALAAFFQPGVGLTPPGGDTGFVAPETPRLAEYLLALIPSNIVKAMANDLYLQIVVFAVFTGIVMNNIHGETDKVKELNAQMTNIVFKMIEWIVRLVPLAVFGFTASMVGTTGWEVIAGLLKLVFLVIGACAVQYLFYLLLIAVFGRLNPLPFSRKMIPTQLFAFSTSSSSATLTTAIRELQDRIGVSRGACNFMLPLGSCINMDGTAIYVAACTVFIAQMYGVDLSMGDYGMLLLTCTLGSIGAAGIPGGSILFMGMVLGSVGLPIEGIGVILGVDRILDMFRTAVNVSGDCAVTVIVDKTANKSLDEDVYFDRKRS